jgi:putative transcriptional regulator
MEDEMKKEHFEGLLASIDEARRYARGEEMPDLKVHVRKVERGHVAAVRLKAGLTQAEFARVLGASLGTVRKWETGERSPSGAAVTLLKVLDADPAAVKRALGYARERPLGPTKRKLVAAE